MSGGAALQSHYGCRLMSKQPIRSDWLVSQVIKKEGVGKLLYSQELHRAHSPKMLVLSFKFDISKHWPTFLFNRCQINTHYLGAHTQTAYRPTHMSFNWQTQINTNTPQLILCNIHKMSLNVFMRHDNLLSSNSILRFNNLYANSYMSWPK